jgi:hypothetical protein
MTTGNKDVPRVFALVRDAEEPNQIVGYGMVLPDGAAYAALPGGAARPADLGFYITKDGVDPEPDPDECGVATAAGHGPSLLRTILAERQRGCGF